MLHLSWDELSASVRIGSNGGTIRSSLRSPRMCRHNRTRTRSPRHYLLDAEVRSARLPEIPVRGDGSLSAVDALLGPAGVGPEEDVWVHVRGHCVPVTASAGSVALPEGLHVLLRHRLLRQP